MKVAAVVCPVMNELPSELSHKQDSTKSTFKQFLKIYAHRDLTRLTVNN